MYNKIKIHLIRKLPSSEQSGTGTKTDTQINRTEWKAQKKPIYLWPINMTREARIYNREKRVSSTSGVGKAGQPHVYQ